MKVTYERRIKELQEKINTLESDVKEKNKENKLNSIKMKDILRFHLDSSIKKTVALPDLNNSLINDNSNKVSMTPKSSQLSETNSNRRSKSIDPQSIHEETKPKVDSNLLSRLRKVKAPSNNMSTLVNKTETTFENELEKASNAKIATINNAIPKIKANNTEVVLGQSALLNHAKQTIAKRVNKAVKEEKDLISETIQDDSQKAIKEVKFSPDIIINHTQPEEQIKEGLDTIDDKFENLGGNNSLNFAI